MTDRFNLVGLLQPSHRPALITPDGDRLSYTALKERVDALAGGLFDEGLRAGDRVSLFLPMSIELYVAMLALFHLGATAVLTDPEGPVADNLARARPVAFIGTPRAHLLRLKVPALRGLGLYVSTGFTPLPHRRMENLVGPVPEPANPDHPALLTFTSGTTGRPKAMARSHGLLLAQHRALAHHMVLGPDDIDLPTLPVFLLHALASRAAAVIPDADLRRPGDVDPATLVEQMQREEVTSTSGSPALLARVAEYLRESRETLPGLRRIFLGGARVPAPLLANLAQVCPNAAIQVLYGSTEAEPIACLDARAHLDELLATERSGRGALVGTPVPDIEVRIVDDEVQVAGPHVNPGYWDEDESDSKIRERLPDGGVRVWHRTGDAGLIDTFGRIWLVGRVGERIGGLWPLQAEGAAEQLPFVRKAGLVEKGGAAVIACELRDPPFDWRYRVAALTGARPVAVEQVPVDARHNAKVDRVALAAMLSEVS